MMMSCPKCGFQQPEDQYCAQCGINMTSFVPAPQSLTARLTKNLKFQILLVIAIITGLISSIYFSQRENIQESLQRAFETASTEKATEDVVEAALVQETAARVAPGPAEETERSAQMAPAASVPTPDSKKTITGIELGFLEVPEPLLQTWAAEGQILSETGMSRSVLIPNVKDLASLRRHEWKPANLGGGETFTLQTGRPITHSLMHPVQGFTAPLGMNIEIEPTAVTGGLEMIVEIVVSMPVGMDNSVNTSTVSGRYTLPSDSALVIFGLVPRQAVSGDVQTELSNGPLSILQSSEFLSGATEFAIAIRPQ
jgi:hypothetical protein